MTVKILVCGGRDYTDRRTLFKTLDDLCYDRNWTTVATVDGNWLPDVIIIHGGARGADDLAGHWAIVNFCVEEVYHADWQKYRNSAGPIRNQKMLTEGKPDLVIAFPTPSSRGTWDMVNRAKKANVETIVIEPNEQSTHIKPAIERIGA